MRKSLFVALTSVVAFSVAAGPVAADFELGHKGKVGPHSTVDSIEAASVRCNYKTVAEKDYPDEYYLWRGKLTRLEVIPPKVRSVIGTQRVGWRFIVQRALNPELTFSDSWKTTYRSAVQTATATETKRARFTPMYVPVDVPRASADRSYGYRIVVKMFWYRADGSVQGTARHLLSYYETFFKERVQNISPPWCDGRISYWLLDGT
jgi:hypothetical protein